MRLHLALALLASSLLVACDNEVSLLDDDPALPVVYGVYNSARSQQTLTVTKTFRFGDEGSAGQSAQTPDSVYYGADELSVVARSLATGSEVVAERYNAADEGVTRQPGDFSTGSVVAYRYNAAGLGIEVGDSLELLLERGGQEIARVRQVRLPELAFVAARQPPSSYPVTSDNDFTFRWQIVQPEQQPLIRAVEIGFNIAITEIRGSERTQRVLYWAAGRDLTGESNATVAAVQLEGFYGFLLDKLDRDPDVVRKFDYMQLVITAGDQAFRDYRALIDANRGITSTQELPIFSNVEGAIGLYGSITQLRQDPGAQLSTSGFDALFGLDGDVFNVAELNFEP